MIYNRDKDVQIFVNRVIKLTPEEFIGLAKLLSVRMSNVDAKTGEYTVRDGEEILNECVAVFRKLPHKARKEVLKAMLKCIEKTARTGGSDNGTTSEHPTQE